MTAPIPSDIPDLPAVPTPGPPALLTAPVPAAAVIPPVRRPLTAAFRLLTAALALTGVTVELLTGGPSVAQGLSLFTVQSNVLLALVLLAAARRAWSARRALPAALTGAAVLYVVAGGLIHHALPAGSGPASPIAVHILCTVTPVAAALDWLLLTTPGRLRLHHAAAWLLYPLAYLAFSLARGELLLPGAEGRYLYPFLDVDQHGYKGVLGNALLLGLAGYALAALLVALDHIRPAPLRHRR